LSYVFLDNVTPSLANRSEQDNKRPELSCRNDSLPPAPGSGASCEYIREKVSGQKEIKEGPTKKTEYEKIPFYRRWIVFLGNI